MRQTPYPIYTVDQIRDIETATSGASTPSLMEKAGRAAAEEAVQLTMDRPGPILIACGPGNNGGDGFVMARCLLQAQRPVAVAFRGDPNALPEDARAAFNAWVTAGGHFVSDLPAAPKDGWSLVVDALFGIGFHGELNTHYAQWINMLNAQPCLRLALDIPSGLNANTGWAGNGTFRATHTLTFIALKPGLLTYDGPDFAGHITVRTLDLTPEAYVPPQGQLIRPRLFMSYLKHRRNNTHKGTYGEVGIIGGAQGMMGAALLSGRAALRLGAGRVYVGLINITDALCVDPRQPELMMREARKVPELASVLAIGPGLGLDNEARTILEQCLVSDKPLIIDADALTLLSRHHNLQLLARSRSAPTLLTPHPGEASRLLQLPISHLQRDRIAGTIAIAEQFQALTLLKGTGSVIATPDGHWLINASGNPGMATAGMGDTLTGLIASLIAQDWPAEQALTAATHLHAAAADALIQEGIGPVGLTASEVSWSARKVFNSWIDRANSHLLYSSETAGKSFIV